jgi:alcohol dehydrogenase (cytochrome c)
LLAAAAAGGGYAYRAVLIRYSSFALNYALSWNAPAGTLALEVAGAVSSRSGASAVNAPSTPSDPRSGEWPSFNRTLTSARYSPMQEITRSNVAALKVLCSYDTRQFSGFQTGPIVVDGMLIGTTESDIFAIDQATCAERWRTHEAFKQIAVNRGAAYLDGMLYRGTGDGRVLAYDSHSGTRLWEATIANPSVGEAVTAAPIAWNGLVFIGNAGGDHKGSRGRIYALEAKSGRVVWEFYLVPKGSDDVTRGPQGSSPLDSSTWVNPPGIPISGGGNWTSYSLDPAAEELYVPAGNSAPDFAAALRKGANLYSGSVVVLDARTGAYKRHYELTTGDWHDWDVSNTPTLVQTGGGNSVMAIAPKDGYLYGFNLASGARMYRTQVTRIENPAVPFSTSSAVHFCPGRGGGAEWNGPAYDPQTNLIFVGSVDWCTTVTLQPDAKIAATPTGRFWVGMATRNPFDFFGIQDSYKTWAGWVYATDADTGIWRWRAKSNYPVVSGLTPTAGGVVFFGDLGGNFYALDTLSGQRLWANNLGGAIAGGVITYSAAGSQKVAVAAGYTAILWPTKVVTGKIVVLGLPQR